MSKTSGTIDLKSLKTASTEATNYVTDIDNNGISVHPKGSDSNKITISNAIEIFKNAVSYLKIWVDNTIAKIRIGKEDSSHFLIQDGKISGYGNTSKVYFETGDAGEDVSQTYIGDGSTQSFELMSPTSITKVTVNGTVVSATLNGYRAVLSSIPADGAKIVIKYKTELNSSPYFTFGTRRTSENDTIGIGSSSFGELNTSSGFYATAEGVSCIANGYASHAEGRECETYGAYSHAEGNECVTWGRNSHAEGNDCVTYGLNSHAGGNDSESRALYSFAHGLGTKTTQNNNLMYGAAAFGRYNYPHAVLFGVGNGESDSDRKNAFSVGVTGNCFIGGKIMSGTPSSNSDDSRAMFLYKQFSEDNLTVAAGAKIGTRAPNVAVTGYTPIAVSTFQIMNASSGGKNSEYCYLYACTLNGNVLAYNGRNTGSSEAKIKTIFNVLYIATVALNGN